MDFVFCILSLKVLHFFANNSKIESEAEGFRFIKFRRKGKMKNVIVGQSGGPTAVINSSLLGVYRTAKERGADNVYGMVHGIKGLIDGKVVNLSEVLTCDLDMDLLKRTPSSFLGSCRYKLPEPKEEVN